MVKAKQAGESLLKVSGEIGLSEEGCYYYNQMYNYLYNDGPRVDLIKPNKKINNLFFQRFGLLCRDQCVCDYINYCNTFGYSALAKYCEARQISIDKISSIITREKNMCIALEKRCRELDQQVNSGMTVQEIASERGMTESEVSDAIELTNFLLHGGNVPKNKSIMYILAPRSNAVLKYKKDKEKALQMPTPPISLLVEKTAELFPSDYRIQALKMISSEGKTFAEVMEHFGLSNEEFLLNSIKDAGQFVQEYFEVVKKAYLDRIDETLDESQESKYNAVAYGFIVNGTKPFSKNPMEDARITKIMYFDPERAKSLEIFYEAMVLDQDKVEIAKRYGLEISSTDGLIQLQKRQIMAGLENVKNVHDLLYKVKSVDAVAQKLHLSAEAVENYEKMYYELFFCAPSERLEIKEKERLLDCLTAEERLVYDSINSGKNTEEIANELHKTMAEVKNIYNNANIKLDRAARLSYICQDRTQKGLSMKEISDFCRVSERAVRYYLRLRDYLNGEVDEKPVDTTLTRAEVLKKFKNFYSDDELFIMAYENIIEGKNGVQLSAKYNLPYGESARRREIVIKKLEDRLRLAENCHYFGLTEAKKLHEGLNLSTYTTFNKLFDYVYLGGSADQIKLPSLPERSKFLKEQETDCPMVTKTANGYDLGAEAIIKLSKVFKYDDRIKAYYLLETETNTLAELCHLFGVESKRELVKTTMQAEDHLKEVLENVVSVKKAMAEYGNDSAEVARQTAMRESYVRFYNELYAYLFENGEMPEVNPLETARIISRLSRPPYGMKSLGSCFASDVCGKSVSEQAEERGVTEEKINREKAIAEAEIEKTLNLARFIQSKKVGGLKVPEIAKSLNLKISECRFMDRLYREICLGYETAEVAVVAPCNINKILKECKRGAKKESTPIYAIAEESE